MAGIQDKILEGRRREHLRRGQEAVAKLMGKLGFTTGETSQMIEDLEQGRSTTVWSHFRAEYRNCRMRPR
jgi:hypothetical protein